MIEGPLTDGCLRGCTGSPHSSSMIVDSSRLVSASDARRHDFLRSARILSSCRTRRGGATRRPSRCAPKVRGRATGTCRKGPSSPHRRPESRVQTSAARKHSPTVHVDKDASPRRIVLDMDSTEIPVYGQHEQSGRPRIRRRSYSTTTSSGKGK
jgi:hypothetical protein